MTTTGRRTTEENPERSRIARGLLQVLVLALSVLFASTLVSCGTTTSLYREVPAAAVHGSPVFLATSFYPLNEWLDETVQVHYDRISPIELLHQRPLKDMQFNLESLPAHPKSFTFRSESITRRELLKMISEHWSLELEYVYVTKGDGKPYAIRVAGR